MNTIALHFGKNKTTLETASCFDELTFAQLQEVVKYMSQLQMYEFPDSLLQSLLGLDEKTIAIISPIQKYALQETFEFLRETPKFSHLICNEITIQSSPPSEGLGVVYYGYLPKFSNTTWEEFIFADQFFMNGQYAEAVAVLYRPKRSDYNGEQDIRIPFSPYGLQKRVPDFANLDTNILSCLVLNYSGLRQSHIVERYPQIFTHSADTKQPQEDNFSWLNVHRNVLGEQYFEEEKILKTAVHTVLDRLNKLLDPKKK